MSPLPTQMIDRWEKRAEPKPGEGTIYWHILFQEQPQVRQLAQYAQTRLAHFSGLHMTPAKWLHMTTLIVGSTEQIPDGDIPKLTDEASRTLSEVPPITVSLGRVLYHPEAIMLGVVPEDALGPVFTALKSATKIVTGQGGLNEPTSWTPHITLCYSTSRQPAEPLIAALGRELPPCDITVDSVSLVIQDGPERLWHWSPVATVPFGRPA
jgi:2'-5' RNA ligase